MSKCPTALAAGFVLVLGVGVATAASAQAAASPVSRIYSAAQNACLDVSTTDPAHYFLDTYGAACDGTTVQAFAFRPVSSGQPNTFHIVSKSSGQCLVKYRSGLRQGACSTDPGWVFQQVGATGLNYNIMQPSTVGTTYPGCIQVNPRPAGYPGAIFTEVICNSSASQVLTLTTAP